MLNLQEPSHLHVMGEVVDRANFMWTGAVNTEYDHDFAEYPLNDEEDIPQQAAAPPHRRRLQRLVDVHDPAAGRRGARPAAAAVHQVGRRRVRPARRRARLSRRRPCPAPRSGTWPGATRTTPSTGRPTSTCATGWSWRPCTGTATSAGLVASHLKATSNTFCALSIRRSPSRTRRWTTSWPGPNTSSPSWSPRCPRCARCASSTPTRWCCRARPRCPTPSDKRWRKKVKHPDEPAGDLVRLTRGSLHQLKRARSGAPRAPADQRRHPGRALVLAVPGRRRHRHHRRRPRRGLPPARPREDVRPAARVADSARYSWPAVQPDAQGLPRRAAGADQQGEVGAVLLANSTTGPDGSAPEPVAPPRARIARSGRRAVGAGGPPGCAVRRARRCPTSVSTASGWVAVSALGRVAQPAAPADWPPSGSARSLRTPPPW